MHGFRKSLLLAVCTVLGATAQASVVNGSFETGNFSGWETLGASLIVTNTVGSGPTDGTYEAIILTTGNGQTVFTATPAQVAAFTGLDPATALTFLTENGLYLQGSAIAQNFSADAGQILSFDWNFLTNEERLLLGGDFAFVTLTPVGGTTELADAITTAVPSSTLFEHETGFTTFSWMAPSTGNYRVSIAILDVFPIVGSPTAPHDFDSALLIDNVRLTVVPEPATMALIGLGLAGLASRRLRRRMK